MKFSCCSIRRSKSAIVAAAAYTSCSAWRTSTIDVAPPCSRMRARSSDSLRDASVRRATSSCRSSARRVKYASATRLTRRRHHRALSPLAGEETRARRLVRAPVAAPEIELPRGADPARADRSRRCAPRSCRVPESAGRPPGRPVRRSDTGSTARSRAALPPARPASRRCGRRSSAVVAVRTSACSCSSANTSHHFASASDAGDGAGSRRGRCRGPEAPA